MLQKVLKVGSSVAVTIPKKSLKNLGIKAGDTVNVSVSEAKSSVTVTPLKSPRTGSHSREKRIAKLTMDFINRYRKDLEALADK